MKRFRAVRVTNLGDFINDDEEDYDHPLSQFHLEELTQEIHMHEENFQPQRGLSSAVKAIAMECYRRHQGAPKQV
jgi:hypothetical protein